MLSAQHTKNTTSRTPLKESSSTVLAKLSRMTSNDSKKTLISTEVKTPLLVTQTKIGPTLHVLEELKKIIPNPENGGPSFKNIALVFGQHLLETTGSVCDFALDLGMAAKNAVMVGKSYSTNAQVVKNITNAGIHVVKPTPLKTIYGFAKSYQRDCAKVCVEAEKIMTSAPHLDPIIMDDGGGVVDALNDESILSQKDPIIVEQTSSGGPIIRDTGAGFVRINLFNACGKIIGEPPLVADVSVENIVNKIAEIHKSDPTFKAPEEMTYGIVGLGNVGHAILKRLIEKGFRKFRVYDKVPDKVSSAIKLGREFDKSIEVELGKTPAQYSASKEEKKDFTLDKHPQITDGQNIELLWAKSDVIIGCTGTDITPGKEPALIDIAHPTIFISVSSKQNEIYALLEYAQSKRAQKKDSFEPIELQDLDIKNGYRDKLKICRLGTPITFNNAPNAIPPERAQLVRGLIASSLVQALEMQKDKIQTEKAGGSFEKVSYKLSPLLQYFVIRTWLDTMTIEEQSALYSKDELNKLLHIESITNISTGKLYLPFEQKARVWLDKWLHEKKLTDEVDAWLNPAPAAPASTPRFKMA